MSNQILDKLLFLVIFVVVAHTLYRFMFPALENGEKDTSTPSTSGDGFTQPEVVQQMVVAPVSQGSDQICALPLFVRHIGEKATVLVRYRLRKKVTTGMMIVWSGGKRKRVQDSYYDLGYIEVPEPSEKVVDQFLVVAMEKLDQLALSGMRKRKALTEEKQVFEVAEPEPVAMEVVAQSCSEEQPEETPIDVVIEENTPEESMRLKRYPSVYRGVITEVGIMKQSKGEREFDTFGVRYTTQEGVVDAVFGAHLRTALKEANASIGDRVEILKIGRKTIEKGKAPMNIFQVAKLKEAAA